MLDLSEAKQIARSSGWLAETPRAFQDAVLDHVSLRRFRAGEMIQTEGDEGRSMSGLVSGYLRARLSACDHGPYFAHLVRPVTWFGEAPAIAGVPRFFTFTATRPVVLVQLAQRDVHAIATSDPQWWPLFSISLIGHFAIANEAIADLMLRDHGKRIVATLLRLGGCRRPGSAEVPPVEVDASHEDLAQIANVARTTCGAFLRRLAGAGLVRLDYGRITLLQPDALRAMIVE